MSKPLTEQGVKALRKVRKHILEEPRRLAMDDWKQTERRANEFISDSYAPYCKPYTYADCKTAACIAGWVYVLAAPKDEPSVGWFSAVHLFGDPCVGGDLFYVDRWDEPYSTKYRMAKTPLAKAKAAAAYINHYIRTRKPSKAA